MLNNNNKCFLWFLNKATTNSNVERSGITIIQNFCLVKYHFIYIITVVTNYIIIIKSLVIGTIIEELYDLRKINTVGGSI